MNTDWSYDKQKVVEDLHKNIWREELIEEDLFKIFRYILTPTEKDITQQKISGLVDGEIAILRKCELQTIKRHISSIKKKYRLGDRSRIDQSHLNYYMLKNQGKLKLEGHKDGKGNLSFKKTGVVKQDDLRYRSSRSRKRNRN